MVTVTASTDTGRMDQRAQLGDLVFAEACSVVHAAGRLSEERALNSILSEFGGYGQASGLPSTTRSTPEPTTDQPRCNIAPFPQVTLLDRRLGRIMKPHPRKRQ
ncbi:MAG: hypothetical protein QOJ06_101 [Pseudonocardiales bacterium]|nr:hypothetical protein [Pseudonocardiales bacterium]